VERSAIDLSVLICSLEERKDSLSFLMDKLSKQKNDSTEILCEVDNREITVGQKRNKLLSRANGEYICFIDDDDDISDNYLSLIYKAIGDEPDCIGLHGLLYFKDKVLDFYHSIQFQDWYTGPDGFYRTPNHLNPVKRKLALKIMFPEMNFGEDQEYSKRIRNLIKTEKYIPEPIYFYKLGEKYELPVD
jgi:glycosyltransferase involved in cell wall biosynthesis